MQTAAIDLAMTPEALENTKRSAAVVGWLFCHALEKGPAVYAGQIFSSQRCAAAEKLTAEADAVRNHNLAVNSQPRKLPEHAQHAAIVSQLQNCFHCLIEFLRPHGHQCWFRWSFRDAQCRKPLRVRSSERATSLLIRHRGCARTASTLRHDQHSCESPSQRLEISQYCSAVKRKD